MEYGDMKDGGVDIGDSAGSAEAGDGAKELTAEEQVAATAAAAAEAEWQAAEARRARIRELGRIRAAAYREKHPEKIKERNIAHYQKNKYEIRS